MQAHSERKANRLINEKSPYLLQHAYNPVDWYPWGKEAFDKANRENKPIFLSIGYSSCHWCHVLAHESFEDEEVAKLLNENFVCIKVDREERPDVDEIYMKAVVSMTGSGGWPLSVFLTPSLEPFYGGTYFPPTPRYGMPSFSNIIRNVTRTWRSDRKNVVESASQMKKALREMYDFKKASDTDLNGSVIDECYMSLVGSYDEAHGGFGDAPKFPMPSNLFFLLRYYARKKAELALSITKKTLDSMMRGGIYDQIGGGFHRYSTDRYWLVPHFEKMLYDNALLVQAYSEAFVVTRNPTYAAIVRETLDWTIREMKDSSGGFYSAQDADSPEGEGSYYVWTRADLKDALKSEPELVEKIEVVANYFSITNSGNFENGKTILTAKPAKLVADEYGMSEVELNSLLKRSRELMLEYRKKRPRPTTDDKILTSWNGLMISGLSKAYQAVGESRFLDAATEAASFVLDHLASVEAPNGKISLLRAFRQDNSGGEAVLEDYSFLINGLIDLYESGFDPKFLESAVSLCETMITKYFDPKMGGFFQTEEGATNLIARAKDAFDGALPSGNSMACLACIRLGEITARDEFKNSSKDTLLAFWEAIARQPSSFAQMLVALDFYLGPSKEIVISGSKESKEVDGFLRLIRGAFVPNSVVLVAENRLLKISPLVEGRIRTEHEAPEVYVCSNFSCKLPSKSSDELEIALNE